MGLRSFAVANKLAPIGGGWQGAGTQEPDQTTERSADAVSEYQPEEGAESDIPPTEPATSDASLMSSPVHSHRHANCATLFCEQHRLREDQFVSTVFWASLHPKARLIGFPLILLFPRVFAADRDFIAQVGRVETMDQYREEEEHFHRWPVQRSFLRKKLCLRVTTRRVRRMVEELIDRDN